MNFAEDFPITTRAFRNFRRKWHLLQAFRNHVRMTRHWEKSGATVPYTQLIQLSAALEFSLNRRIEKPGNTTLEIAQVIAEEIGMQCETDNLGDGESVCFMESLPTLNLVAFTEGLIERGIIKP